MTDAETYFADQLQIIGELARGETPRATLDTILELIARARAERRQIFVFGNGGSASTASHFACDLGKNTVRDHLPRFRIISLNDNMPMFSAYANDEGYECVFVEPLLSLAEPGDVAIAFSASGNSPNVVRAIEAANARGVITIGFAGMGGGALRQLAQYSIVVPSNSYEHIEDLHLMFCHVLVYSLKRRGDAAKG